MEGMQIHTVITGLFPEVQIFPNFPNEILTQEILCCAVSFILV